MLGESFGGSGGGGRLGGFKRIGVRSVWMHWLMNGIIEEVDELLFDFARWTVGKERLAISLVDFERLRITSSWFVVDDVSNGEVDFVRNILLDFEWRREDWNDVERVKDVFAEFNRSK